MIYRRFPNLDFTCFISINSYATASTYEVRTGLTSVGCFNEALQSIKRLWFHSCSTHLCSRACGWIRNGFKSRIPCIDFHLRFDVFLDSLHEEGQLCCRLSLREMRQCNKHEDSKRKKKESQHLSCGIFSDLEVEVN